MKKRNYKLLQAIDERGWTQAELTRRSNLQSETRLSYIVNGHLLPNENELLGLTAALGKTAKELGLCRETGE